MSRLRLFGGYYLGTGLISVVGTSFATLSTANAVRITDSISGSLLNFNSEQIFNTMYADGTCPSTVASDGTVTRGPCPDAYGMVLGTLGVCTNNINRSMLTWLQEHRSFARSWKSSCRSFRLAS